MKRRLESIKASMESRVAEASIDARAQSALPDDVIVPETSMAASVTTIDEQAETAAAQQDVMAVSGETPVGFTPYQFQASSETLLLGS